MPVLFAGRQHGSVRLLILGAYHGASGEDEDPLDLKPDPARYHGEAPPPEALLRESWSDIVIRHLSEGTVIRRTTDEKLPVARSNVSSNTMLPSTGVTASRTTVPPGKRSSDDSTVLEDESPYRPADGILAETHLRYRIRIP